MRGIVATPGTCGGRPRFAGTRIWAQLIASLVHEGYPVATCVEWYPVLSEEDVRHAAEMFTAEECRE